MKNKYNYNDIKLIDFLNYYVDNDIIMLTDEDKKDLIKNIDVEVNGKLLKSIGVLNGALKERKINFMIVELCKIIKIINGKKYIYKTPWKVIKLDVTI